MSIGVEHEPDGKTSGRDFCIKHNEERIGLMDKMNIPKGWVIDGKRGNSFWRHVGTFALPLKPKGNILPSHRKAQKAVVEVEKHYGEPLIMVIVPSDKNFEGWMARFIFKSDLGKPRKKLLSEAVDALNNEDLYLSEMKQQASKLAPDSSSTEQPYK